jgi:hypothetical protein
MSAATPNNARAELDGQPQTRACAVLAGLNTAHPNAGFRYQSQVNGRAVKSPKHCQYVGAGFRDPA